jgi:hypothetical protein
MLKLFAKRDCFLIIMAVSRHTTQALAFTVGFQATNLGF